MQKKDQYYRGGHCKFKLTIHIVFVTKYRRAVIINDKATGRIRKKGRNKVK